MDALRRYVSNLDKRVYLIENLPEEVIAVVFAYVSRSPAGFRENLAKLLAEGDVPAVGEAGESAALAGARRVAGDFHEKWVIGYGHSSVAEHAVAHIGIEDVSRLASAELELANRFNSFTEYSQRYQRPKRGAVYIPPELDSRPAARELYRSFQDRAFDVYEQLYGGLMDYLPRVVPKKEGEGDRAYRSRLEKMAFEDARYALSLATLTSLGMTGNGRALRDTLVRLLSGPYRECRELAREMEEEISKSLPTLLRHVRPSGYRAGLWERFSAPPAGSGEAEEVTVRTGDLPHDRNGGEVRWLDVPDYRKALQALVAGLWTSHGWPLAEALQRSADMSLEELEKWVRRAWEDLEFFEHPHEAFHSVTYRVAVSVSEANWHQLLRHNRGAHFVYGPPRAKSGCVVPPRVEEAGLAELLFQLVERADEVWESLLMECPEAAPYCVINAHRREVIMTADLWELYHLINLRTSPDAQWDIRRTFERIEQELAVRHPALIGGARRRGDRT